MRLKFLYVKSRLTLAHPMPTDSRSRREFLRAGAAALLAGGCAPSVWAAADPTRIALVIGNNGYRQSPLGNAVNDAKAMASLLERAGFTVTLKLDVDRDGLHQAAVAFGAAARRNETRQVFFYYAGHGAQLNWRNFLVPVDARITSGNDLPDQCLELGALLTELSKARGKVFVLILDACRDNPFGNAFQPNQKGLSQFDAPAGSLLAFSTSPGSVAADGSGANGLYTENLVRELAVVGARLEEALKRVRLAVRVASRGAQVPWESTSLETDVYVFPAGHKLTEAELEADYAREIALWNRVKASQSPDDWIGYLRAYPSGKFTEIAQNRLAYLMRMEEERVLLAQTPPVPAAAGAAAPPPTTVMAVATSTTTASALRPQLELGPGLPRVELMRPSPNPASAGSYPINRRYSVGDEETYAVSDLIFGGNKTIEVHRVTSVDEAADRVEINNGAFVYDAMGNFVRIPTIAYDPRLQMFPAVIQVGNKWTTRYNVREANGLSELYYDYVVLAREKIRVPAGEFDSFKIEGNGFNMTYGDQNVRRVWIVPGLNATLRSELIIRPRNFVVRNSQLRELVSCRQMLWTAV